MSRLTTSYKRLRHSRGYGVHSPSSYTLVRELVHPPRGYAYYCYADLPRSIRFNRGNASERRRVSLNLRLLMRLALWCRPQLVTIAGAPVGVKPYIEAAIRYGCPDAACNFGENIAGEADMEIHLSAPPRHISSRARAVLCRRSPEAIAKLSQCEGGVLMRGRHQLLYFATPAPFHILDMWI